MLPPLATTSDLTDRNITVPSGMSASVALASASDAVREAAGCPISQTTSTVTLVAQHVDYLDLPAGPVTAVASVQVAGVDVPGWVKIGDDVYFTQWWTDTLPVEVRVVYTHGYPVIPADIVDLVCGITALVFAADGAYGSTGRTNSIHLGDFSEGFVVPPGTESPSPTAIPDATRQRLRARFGTSVAAVYMKAS